VTSDNLADLELAQRIVETYRDLPGLNVAMIVGSVARGIADQSSDLDLYLYWNRADRDALGQSNRLEPLGIERLFGVATPTGVFEKHRLRHRMIDVESVDVAAFTSVVDWIDRGEAMSPAVEKTVSGIIDGIAVFGHDELARWQRKIRYSDALARAQVDAHAGKLLPPLVLYKLTLGRNDALSFSARISAVLLHAVALVAAANRAFISVAEPKWLPWQLGRLTITPPHMSERVNAALSRPSLEAMNDLSALLAEVLDLVERHIPDANTSVGRFILSMD
jgi:hypothetical protein